MLATVIGGGRTKLSDPNGCWGCDRNCRGARVGSQESPAPTVGESRARGRKGSIWQMVRAVGLLDGRRDVLHNVAEPVPPERWP